MNAEVQGISETELAPRNRGWREMLARGVGLAVVLATAVAASAPLRQHADWRLFVQDDSFYYLAIARNLSTGHGSTFNGIVPTNGYQPLWLWIIALVEKLAHQPGDMGPFFAASAWIATVVVYFVAMRLLCRAGYDRLLSAIFAAYVAAYSWSLFSLAMETTLALPLAAVLLLCVQSPEGWLRVGWNGFRRSVALGLLASATCLARLDAAFFVFLLGCGIVLVPEIRRRIHHAVQLGGLATGLLPLLAYVISNRVLFQTWLPVSGMSKQLKLDHGFTALAWRSAFVGAHTTQGLNPLLTVLALALLPFLFRQLRTAERAFVPAGLLFPMIHVAALSWLSDWPLWVWYSYSFRISILCAILLFFRPAFVQRFITGTAASVALLLLVGVRLATLKWQPGFPDIIEAADHLKLFAATHPGVYAMGDRSGAVGYMLPEPVIQTEGLVMDRNFVRHIARQEPLREALSSYGVRYYVGTSFGPYEGCFHAVEPAQGGAHTPKMRATFCEQPVYKLVQASGMETLVFDLRPQQSP